MCFSDYGAVELVLRGLTWGRKVLAVRRRSAPLFLTIVASLQTKVKRQVVKRSELPALLQRPSTHKIAYLFRNQIFLKAAARKQSSPEVLSIRSARFETMSSSWKQFAVVYVDSNDRGQIGYTFRTFRTFLGALQSQPKVLFPAGLYGGRYEDLGTFESSKSEKKAL
jgi:hypothetical protein